MERGLQIFFLALPKYMAKIQPPHNLFPNPTQPEVLYIDGNFIFDGGFGIDTDDGQVNHT